MASTAVVDRPQLQPISRISHKSVAFFIYNLSSVKFTWDPRPCTCICASIAKQICITFSSHRSSDVISFSGFPQQRFFFHELRLTARLLTDTMWQQYVSFRLAEKKECIEIFVHSLALFHVVAQRVLLLESKIGRFHPDLGSRCVLSFFDSIRHPLLGVVV